LDNETTIRFEKAKPEDAKALALEKCKACWCDMIKCKGLCVKLALGDSEWAVGILAACSLFISNSGRRRVYAG
jgi:hypothetical protein